jgi:predicted SAM-dependent methyltransferase
MSFDAHDSNVTKVNFGCGPRGLEDWVNVDWGLLSFVSRVPKLRRLLIRLGLLDAHYDLDWPTNLRLHDCRKPIPFADASVDFIYTSHFIEHLYRFETERFLRECWRILNPGGTIRVVVPDLELLVSKYMARDRHFFEQMESAPQQLSLADLFVVHFYGFHCEQAPQGFITRVQRRFIRGHLWMYDFESLSAMLMTVGFVYIRRCAAGEGRVPDLDYLDMHPHVSLHIEASKDTARLG